MKQVGFLFDQSRCIGCYTCVAACRSAHRLGPDAPEIITLVKKEFGRFRISRWSRNCGCASIAPRRPAAMPVPPDWSEKMKTAS